MSDRIFAGFWLLLCIGGLFIGWGIKANTAMNRWGRARSRWRSSA